MVHVLSAQCTYLQVQKYCIVFGEFSEAAIIALFAHAHEAGDAWVALSVLLPCETHSVQFSGCEERRYKS